MVYISDRTNLILTKTNVKKFILNDFVCSCFIQTYGSHVENVHLLWRPFHEMVNKSKKLDILENSISYGPEEGIFEIQNCLALSVFELNDIQCIDLHNQRWLENERLNLKGWEIKWKWNDFLLRKSIQALWHLINCTTIRLTPTMCLIHPISVLPIQFEILQLEGFSWMNWRHRWIKPQKFLSWTMDYYAEKHLKYWLESTGKCVTHNRKCIQQRIQVNEFGIRSICDLRVNLQQMCSTCDKNRRRSPYRNRLMRFF